jgi:hypothetical protein
VPTARDPKVDGLSGPTRPDAGVDVMARLASQKGLTGPAIIRYMISTLEQELVLAEADALAAAGGGRVPGSKGGDPTQR